MLQADLYKKENQEFISANELMQISSRVVAAFVKRKSLPQREAEDAQMAILEKFLSKYNTIRDSYSGNAKVQTYCIAIMNRMCCEFIRKDNKHWDIVADEDNNGKQSGSVNLSDLSVINDELKWLDTILLLFDKESAKVRLFLLYYFYLTILDEDFEAYDAEWEVHNLKQILASDNELKKAEIFQNLQKVVQLVEKKDVKSDAVRMWLNKSMDKIILRLNGPFGQSKYDKESLQLLFEFYQEHRNKEGNNQND